MPLLFWTKEMSVNIALLDEDHRKIISAINKLYDAIKEGEGRSALSEIFDMLSVYIHTHFESEAQLFARINYPEAETHMRLHDDLSQKMKEIKLKFNEGDGAFIPTEALAFLKEWWTGHIMTHDMKYVAYMRDMDAQ